MKLTEVLKRQENKQGPNPLPPGKLYHLSEKELPSRLSPRVPRNYMTEKGYEDGETARISASNSIDGALRALSANLSGKTFFVYELVTKSQVIKPTTTQVPDSEITEERWILGDAIPKLLGQIKVGAGYGKGHKYTYGNNSAKLYDWHWDVVYLAKKET